MGSNCPNLLHIPEMHMKIGCSRKQVGILHDAGCPERVRRGEASLRYEAFGFG